jgi:hypothetical protein
MDARSRGTGGTVTVTVTGLFDRFSDGLLISFLHPLIRYHYMCGVLRNLIEL